MHITPASLIKKLMSCVNIYTNHTWVSNLESHPCFSLHPQPTSSLLSAPSTHFLSSFLYPFTSPSFSLYPFSSPLPFLCFSLTSSLSCLSLLSLYPQLYLASSFCFSFLFFLLSHLLSSLFYSFVFPIFLSIFSYFSLCVPLSSFFFIIPPLSLLLLPHTTWLKHKAPCHLSFFSCSLTVSATLSENRTMWVNHEMV